MITDIERRRRWALANIGESQELIERAKAELAHHIVVARNYGFTWAEVGAALGISRQAAHLQYRDAKALSDGGKWHSGARRCNRADSQQEGRNQYLRELQADYARCQTLLRNVRQQLRLLQQAYDPRHDPQQPISVKP